MTNYRSSNDTASVYDRPVEPYSELRPLILTLFCKGPVSVKVNAVRHKMDPKVRFNQNTGSDDA